MHPARGISGQRQMNTMGYGGIKYGIYMEGRHMCLGIWDTDLIDDMAFGSFDVSFFVVWRCLKLIHCDSSALSARL